MTPPRIAVLARAAAGLHGYGGLERHVADLVRHLAACGAEVTLVTRPGRDNGDLASAFGPHTRVCTVPYLTFPLAGRRGTTVIDRATAYPIFGWRAGRLAASLVRAGQIDWVYGLGASALGYAQARRRGTASAPLVLNPQGLEEFGGPDGRFGGSRLKALGYRPLQAAVRVCARAADRVIATDRALVPLVTRHLPVDPGAIVIVPNAVDLDACDRLASTRDGLAVRQRSGLNPETPIVLSVGRIERNKGFHLLADALGRLADTDWVWVHAGDGPNRPALERAIDAAAIRGRVRLVGRPADADLHAWYEAATVFVHPTLYEGSSLVTLEAMAHRRAVVATTAGGLPDKVRPGVSGWLVAPGDAAALAVAIADALAVRARLPEMGAAGRAMVEREFAWPIVAARLLALGASLVGPTRP